MVTFTGNMSTRSKSKRWIITVLSYMLDTTRVNSCTLASLHQDMETLANREFSWALVRELTEPHILRRALKPKVMWHVRERMRSWFGKSFPYLLLSS